MDYLKAAIALKSLIEDTNSIVLQKTDEFIKSPNQMRIKLQEGNIKDVVMDTFSNEFVNNTLESIGGSEAFVITDIASMDVKGKKLDYLLYKGYHSKIEKGMVFFQLIDKQSLVPNGQLQFSNMEENIFYTVDFPQSEESSCNALETDRKVEKGKGIVFLIGHMDEHRLVYDIERLIFDTVNNVSKHPQLQFSFIIQIDRFGGSPSQELREQVAAIEEFTKNNICPEYPNTAFEFVFGQDES